MAHTDIEILFESLHESLEKEARGSVLAEKQPVYIYGAGNVGKDVYRVLVRNGISVSGFLDQKAQAGSCWEGISIVAPDSPALSAEQKHGAQVILGIFNRETEMPPIIERLKSLGYGKVISILEIQDQFASELGDRFWLTSRGFYTTQKKQIAAACELWSDNVSRELFTSILKFRFERNYDVLPKPSLDDQYFPVGLPSWPSPMRLIDCGAYDGDTLRYLAHTKLPLEAIAAFEPDPINYSKLVDTAEQLQASETICLFPCGVDSETKQVRFVSGQGSASRASEQGESVIQCVKLDDALVAYRPNLIKMDIEGAEYAALLGAEKMITCHRPGLAISVYHCAEHLWTIPLLAQAWLKGGRHYLRSHAYNGFELIYYWIP
jgi:FkbM family methyltransferase